MLLITASFDMSWPQEVQMIFNLAAPIQQVTSSITSFDCYMDKRSKEDIEVYNFYADPNELRIVYQKLFIMAFLPILLAIISYSAWWIILKYQN